MMRPIIPLHEGADDATVNEEVGGDRGGRGVVFNIDAKIITNQQRQCDFKAAEAKRGQKKTITSSPMPGGSGCRHCARCGRSGAFRAWLAAFRHGNNARRKLTAQNPAATHPGPVMLRCFKLTRQWLGQNKSQTKRHADQSHFLDRLSAGVMSAM